MIYVELAALVVTVVLATVLWRFIPRDVVATVAACIVLFAAFTSAMTWLDLDKFAMLGPILIAVAICTVPLSLRYSFSDHPPLRALLDAPSMSPLLGSALRYVVIGAMIALLIALAVWAVLGTIQVYGLSEYVFDGGQPS